MRDQYAAITRGDGENVLMRVIAVAIVHELAVWTAGQLEVADEHVSRIECAIIVSIPCVMVRLARGAVAAAQVFHRRPWPTRRRHVRATALFLAIVNAVVSLARIDIAGIEIAGIKTSQHRQAAGSGADDLIVRAT